MAWVGWLSFLQPAAAEVVLQLLDHKSGGRGARLPNFILVECRAFGQTESCQQLAQLLLIVC